MAPEPVIDIISIGSAVQDLFVNVPVDEDQQAFVRSNHLYMSLGSKINVDYPLFEIGGAGTNSAVNFHIQGLKAAILSRIANDKAGEEVLSRLRQFHVNTEFLQIESNREAHTGMSVILNVPGQDRTVLVNRGVSHQINFDEVNWNRLSMTKWVYVANFGSKTEDAFDRIADWATEKGIHIAFNPGISQIQKGMPYLKKIVEASDIMVMNRSEAAKLTGSSKTERVTVLLQKLSDMGAKVAIMTDGRNGVFAADNKNGRFFVPAVPVESTSTLGAGDAFASTCAASIIQNGWDLPLALKRGAMNSALVVQNLGAQIGLEPMERLDAYLEEANLEVEDLSPKASKKPV